MDSVKAFGAWGEGSNPSGGIKIFYKLEMKKFLYSTLINPLACATFPECIEKIIGFVLWVATAIVPIMIIVAGFLFLTSGGDPEKARTAKRIIFWTVIGLAIILLAKGIISVIKQIIGG